MSLQELKQNLSLVKDFAAGFAQTVDDLRSDTRLARQMTGKDFRSFISLSTKISEFNRKLDILIKNMPDPSNVSDADYDKFLLEVNDFYFNDLDKNLLGGRQTLFAKTDSRDFVILIDGHLKDIQSLFFDTLQQFPFRSGTLGKHRQTPVPTLPIYSTGNVHLHDPEQKIIATPNSENNNTGFILNCPQDVTSSFCLFQVNLSNKKTFYSSWSINREKPETETKFYFYDFSTLTQKHKTCGLFLSQVGIKEADLAKASFIYPPTLKKEKPESVLMLDQEPMVAIKLPKRVVCITKDRLDFKAILEK